MKKTYKIDVDCANCANLMEDAARKTAGVAGATPRPSCRRSAKPARKWSPTVRFSCKQAKGNALSSNGLQGIPLKATPHNSRLNGLAHVTPSIARHLRRENAR